MQKITIIGRLGRDAQVRTTQQNGTRFLTMTVAANTVIKGVENTTWYDIVTYNVDRYEKMLPYLTKGSGVVVVGELFASLQNDNNGRTFIRMQVTADSIDFNSTGGQSGNTNNNAETATTTTQAAASAPTVVNMAENVADEDIVIKKKPAKKAEKPIVEETESNADDLPF